MPGTLILFKFNVIAADNYHFDRYVMFGYFTLIYDLPKMISKDHKVCYNYFFILLVPFASSMFELVS